MVEPQVEYRFLGKSGVKVSNVCLGTMTFGTSPSVLWDNPRQCSEELSNQIMDSFASYGGNFLDTANVYSSGNSERIIGSWLAKQERDRFVVATKVRSLMDASDVNSLGLSRRHIVQSCEESLERLQTNYIDLYQCHLSDDATCLKETLRTFDDLIRCGKIRYFGVSNVCGWQLQKIVDRIEAMGLNSCVSLQQQYNLMCRQSDFEEFRVCKNEGIGVLPWSPLKMGLLTGKHKREKAALDPANSRYAYAQAKKTLSHFVPDWNEIMENEQYWTLIDTLSQIATTHGKSIPQVAIRWLLQKDIVTSVIIGATSVKQLEDNMGAAMGWELSAEEIKRLDDSSFLMDCYPYTLMKAFNVNRKNPFL